MRRRAREGLRSRARDLVEFLEAVYQLEADEQTWLANVTAARRRFWAGGGRGRAPSSVEQTIHHCIARHIAAAHHYRRRLGQSPPQRGAGLDVLSERERQVVAYLAGGQSTKETAYTLGIADATVRVLVARAVAKLGSKNRRALLEHPEVRALVLGNA